jgi:DNA repair protein RadA
MAKAKEVKEDIKEELDLTVSQLGGVGAITAKKLFDFGVTSLVDVCVRGAKELSEITGVAKVKTNVWVTESKKILEDNNMIRKPDMNTLELMEYQEKLFTLGTKTEVDTLLRGGVRPECMYEVYGEFGSGKTQFCLTLAAEAISDGHKIVWIDCEDTFRPRRLAEIIVARGYAVDTEDAKQHLNNIHYYYCPNTEQMMGKVNALSPLLTEHKPKLVILDGAIGQFREEYLGRGTLAERQNQIAHLMTHLKNISYYFNCTVLFTNQVQSDPSIMFGDPVKPIGGHVVGHAPTYRMYFKKSGRKHIARMVDSPEDPVADIQFDLTVKGISDVET